MMRQFRSFACCAAALVISLASAQVAAPPPAAAAQASAAPLQAIFIEVEGKVRWRAGEKADWKDAVVNDLVEAGVEIRTGLKGRAALRVGKNATVLVDAGTTFQLPTIVQEGETLRTLGAVKSGRVDFKVDKVGFANDFKVLTPQTTLAVRGTGFGVTSGPLTGTEVVGARTNQINAIELRYVTQNIRFFLSGAAMSSSERKDPVRNAWLGTVGPPQVAGTLVDSSQLEQTAAQGQAGNAPTSAQFFQQIASAQTQQEFGSSVLDLLRLEERAADAANDRSGLTLSAAGAAGLSAGAARAGVLARNEHIDEAVRVRDLLENAWGGSGGGQSLDSARLTPGAEERLTQLRDQGATDLAAVGTQRTALETAITAQSESGVTAALDAIGVIDDSWRNTLGVEAQSIMTNLSSLNSQIQAAYELAESKDSQYFNALLPPAESDAALAQGLASTLAGLREAVQRYQQAVVDAVRSGQANSTAIAQLLRSVEVLRDVERRIDAALSAVGSASELLRDARSLSERVLLAAAFTAKVRGTAIMSLASGLKTEIDGKASAIDVARFDAFYRSVEAGLDGISAGAALASSEADAVAPFTDQVAGAAASVKPLLETALADANQVNAYWTTSVNGGASPKDRMQQLQQQSATDRTLMATNLTGLQDSIAGDDRSGADLFIGDMQSLNNLWWTPETGLVFEAQGINGQMVARMATLEQSWQTADTADGQVRGLLSSAEQRRDAAIAAVNRIEAIKARLEQYQAQYLALAEAGRGGGGQATTVQQGISELASLTALGSAYAEAISKSSAAAAAVTTARSNAERVLYSAASDAYLRSVGQAGDSAAAMAIIQSNAELLRGDFTTGQAAYDAKYPPNK